MYFPPPPRPAVSQAAPAAPINKARRIDLRQRWAAQWIAAPRWPARAGGVFHFRKIVTLARAPRHFPVAVSADMQFLLRVNGRRAGDGPARGNPQAWRYERYELAPYLHAGRNILAATVWNFGARAPVARMSERTGFILQGLTTAAAAVADTNRSWQVERDRGWRLYANPAARLHGYYAALPGVRLDARRADLDWSQMTDHSPNRAWRAPALLGAGSPRGLEDAPNGWWLVRDRLPAMAYRPTSAGHVVRVSATRPIEGCASAASCVFPQRAIVIPAHNAVRILIERHALTTAWPRLWLAGGAGSRVTLVYAEALRRADGRKGNRNNIRGKHIEGVSDHILADGGRIAFQPPEWRTWRFLELRATTGAAPLRVTRLSAEYTAFPFHRLARFVTRRAWLRRAWQVSWRTARLCAHTTYMDCPYWEQLQYIGDTRIQALLSYTLADDDRLARQAITQLNQSRIPAGITQSRYPSALPQMIPPFALMWVGMVRDFWQYRGDAAFTRSQLPGVEAALGWFLRRQQANGMLGQLPWWNFVDWTRGYPGGTPPGARRGESAALTLEFAAALRNAARLESALGSRSRALRYRRQANAAVSAIRRLYWSRRAGLVADTPARRRFSQETNILAVWQGVVSRRRGRAVLRKILGDELKTASATETPSSAAPEARTQTRKTDASQASTQHRSAQPASRQFNQQSRRTEALTKRRRMKPGAGAASPAITPASYYFRFYLARALLRAGMGNDYLRLLAPWRAMLRRRLTTWAEMPPPTRSDCHAWSAHPGFDLLATVAGIRPAAPGYRRVRIAPHLGDLHNLRATLPTPQGRIRVRYARAGGELSASVRLPAGVDGVFRWNGRRLALHAGWQSFILKAGML